MGLVHFGIPEKEAIYLRDMLNLDIFVEGGTYVGGTARKMSKFFKKVYTIEKSEKMFEIARQNLKGISNVIMILGDTREYLSKILDENDNILFWLDSHGAAEKHME